jgi:hypothetical protein
VHHSQGTDDDPAPFKNGSLRGLVLFGLYAEKAGRLEVVVVSGVIDGERADFVDADLGRALTAAECAETPFGIDRLIVPQDPRLLVEGDQLGCVLALGCDHRIISGDSRNAGRHLDR